LQPAPFCASHPLRRYCLVARPIVARIGESEKKEQQIDRVAGDSRDPILQLSGAQFQLESLEVRELNDVFMSYAREDRALVEQLAEAFDKAGLHVWWDRKIEAGTRFDEVLETELNQSRCVVVAWSQNSVESDWVRSEAHDGFDRGILMPVMLDNVVPPLPFKRMQSANLSGWPTRMGSENEFEKLLSGIRRVLVSADNDSGTATSAAPTDAASAKTAVAVLPLQLRSSDADDEYLADGITEDIISRLQRFRTFPIIPRHSVFTYKGQEYELPKIAMQLDVAYLVVGQLRKHGKRLRIAIELVETTNFHSIWSEQYDRDMVDIFDLQDEISLIVAAKLEPEITRSERQKSLPARNESIASWHLVRRGLFHQHKMTREDAVEAKRFFELALEQEPDSTEALIQLAWWHWWDLSRRRGRKEDDLAAMTDLSKRAIALDPKDARPVQQIGIAKMLGGKPDAALKIFKQAMELNPCLGSTYDLLGSSYELTGEPNLALGALNTAISLSPFELWIFHAESIRACAHYSLGDYENCIDAADRSMHLRPGYWLAHMIKTIALAKSGRIDEAQESLTRLLKYHPKFGVEEILWMNYTDPARAEDFIDNLKLAGWQPAEKKESTC
jgi:adenylate cyclase